MVIVEIILCILCILLCLITSKSDIKEGIIPNKILLYFCGIAFLVDIIFYCILCRYLLHAFIGNVIIISIISLALFYSHSFAGGDCKLIIVLALLYPAGTYYQLNENPLTLYFALGLGIFWGYIYLLFDSMIAVIKKKNTLSKQYVKLYLLNFVKLFFTGMIYITLINCLVNCLRINGITINAWIIRFFCILTAWFIGKYSVFRKWYLLTIIFILDLIICSITRFLPININPENYLLVLVLLLCQLIIRTNLYETIQIQQLKKGMILSAQSSIPMQSSRVKGLPGISFESLKDRLTEEEAASVQRWAKYRGITTITVVKKIPFAVFISLGFLSYFLMWCLL